MNKSLVTFKPLEPYFFTGEKTYFRTVNKTEEEKQDKKNKSYIILSRHYPQNTTLLGVLRKEVLIASENFDYKHNLEDYNNDDKKDMKELIGEKGFEVNGKNDFGKIISLSNIYLIDDNNYYIPVPLDHKYGENHYSPLCCTEKHNTNFGEMFLPDGIKTKMRMPDGIMSIDGTCYLEADDVFKREERIGINKQQKKDSEKNKDAFFKKRFISLRKNFKFAVVLEHDSLFSENYSNVVYLGREKSSFLMEIKNFNTASINHSLINDANEKIILLSNAYITGDIYKLCSFAFTDVDIFKPIKYRNQYKDDICQRYNSQNKHYTMLKAGSVLIPQKGSKKDIIKILNSDIKNSFYKIGYNKYISNETGRK